MITAIPMEGGQISNHFKKASQFIFLNQQGQFVGHMMNPAYPDTAKSCSSTKELMAQFQQRNVDRVVVRNIGERMLDRLIAAGLAVWQTATGRVELSALAAGDENLTKLDSAEQGRPSVNYIEKQLKGGSCSGGTDNHAGGCCSSSEHEPQVSGCGGKGKKGCCGR